MGFLDAPWCIHCKKVAPVWEKLARKFVADPGVVIATIDGTLNDVADVRVIAYPSFLLFPSGPHSEVRPRLG